MINSKKLDSCVCMSIVSSLFYLLIASDFFSQCLVILLILSGSTVFILFFYGLIKLQYKKKEIDAVIEMVKNNSLSIKDNNNFGSFFLYSMQKKYSEELLDQMVASYLYKEIKIKLFFGIAAVTGPLLGLLGTIWGVMHVFIAIQGSFDIKIIAPGIAEALITTLAGLFVAIPASIAYHIMAFQIKSYVSKVELCYLYYKEGDFNAQKK